jgi:hypothetical protein
MVDRVRADLPPVHVGMDFLPPNGAVWDTSNDCYRFLAKHCAPGTRTLETGLGTSTVLFTAWGCEHTCVVPSKDEVSRCIAYLDDRGLDRSRVRFEIGYSQDVLPRLEPAALDTVFIDGAHGFPMAIIDYFYTGGRLIEGGWLVVDDMQLPSVRWGLLDFLELDPRWELDRRTPKWAAWRRVRAGPVAEHESAQKFLGPPDGRGSWLRRVIPEPLRPLARRARRTVRHWIGQPTDS